jgi:hypothetical protein
MEHHWIQRKVWSMKRTIETKVIGIENEEGEKPRIVLQCCEGETIAAKATVSASPIMVEQEALVAGVDRINVHLGDTVEVQVVSTTT